MRSTRLARVLVLTTALLLWASTSQSATFLYLHPGPGGAIGGRLDRFITADDGLFFADRASGGVSIHLGNLSEENGLFWDLSFAAPDGGPLLPGTYEGATWFPFHAPGVPGLSVSGNGSSCDARGRFVVHEITYEPDSSVGAFAADFEQHCFPDPEETLVGAIRYRSGDAPCAAVPDGTPCDEHDPCTRGDVCRAGVCRGTDAVSATCTAPGPCQEGGLCNRTTGSCSYGTRGYGEPCHGPCTTAGMCNLDQCLGQPVDCDDGSACTTDACDPTSGCVHEPVAGACWVYHAVASGAGTGSAYGRTAHCTISCRSPVAGTLILGPAGTYREIGRTFACPSGLAVDFPDEVGTVHPGRRGRLVLEPSNLGELLPIVGRCAGADIRRIRSYHFSLRPTRDGRLRGKATLQVHVPGSVPVDVTAVERFIAVAGLGPTGPVEPPVSRPRLRECTPHLKASCTVD